MSDSKNGTPAEKTVMAAKLDASRCRILLAKGIDPKDLRDKRAEEAKKISATPTFQAYAEMRGCRFWALHRPGERVEIEGDELKYK